MGQPSHSGPRVVHERRSASLSRMKTPLGVPTSRITRGIWPSSRCPRRVARGCHRVGAADGRAYHRSRSRSHEGRRWERMPRALSGHGPRGLRAGAGAGGRGRGLEWRSGLTGRAVLRYRWATGGETIGGASRSSPPTPTCARDSWSIESAWASPSSSSPARRRRRPGRPEPSVGGGDGRQGGVEHGILAGRVRGPGRLGRDVDGQLDAGVARGTHLGPAGDDDHDAAVGQGRDPGVAPDVQAAARWLADEQDGLAGRTESPGR